MNIEALKYQQKNVFSLLTGIIWLIFHEHIWFVRAGGGAIPLLQKILS